MLTAIRIFIHIVHCLLSSLSAVNLIQHVSFPTQECGDNTLDLVIISVSYDLSPILSCEFSSPSEHYPYSLNSKISHHLTPKLYSFSYQLHQLFKLDSSPQCSPTDHNDLFSAYNSTM